MSVASAASVFADFGEWVRRQVSSAPMPAVHADLLLGDRDELPGNIFLGQFRPPSNAAITMIDPHPPALISYNETCHLSANARVLGGRRSGVALIR